MVNNIQEKMIEQVFKKNIFILLQIIWIIEFYILGFLAIDSAIKKIFDIEHMRYEIIENICYSVVDKIKEYSHQSNDKYHNC